MSTNAITQTIFLSDGESSRFPIGKFEIDKVNRRKSQAREAARTLNTLDPIFLDYPDNMLDSIPLLEIIKKIEELTQDFRYERILTHNFSDLNIDHRVACEVSQVLSRPTKSNNVKELIFFETPSATGWRFDGSSHFNPNLFIDISNAVAKKIKAYEHYISEIPKHPHPRSIQGIMDLAKYRGSMVGVDFAEAFQIGFFRH